MSSVFFLKNPSFINTSLIHWRCDYLAFFLLFFGLKWRIREDFLVLSRRLVEKEERLEATINSLKAQHGEDTSAEAIEELRELIIPAEREQLKKLKLSLAK